MKINKDTPVDKIVEEYPHSVSIFQKYGINVIVCGQVVWHSLGELCEENGVDPDRIINDIVQSLKKN